MEKNPSHPHPQFRPQPHDFLNVFSENNFIISKGLQELSSSSSSPPLNLEVSTELSLSSSFSTSPEPSSFTKSKTKRNIANNKERKIAPNYYYSNTKVYHPHYGSNIISQQPSSSFSHGRCSTALRLYDDPWKIKKVLTTSDLGKLNRLLLSTENPMEDMLVSLMGNNNNKNKNNNNNNEDLGRLVRVWDVETKSMYQLILKQWSSIKNYVLIGKWNQDFVRRRDLKKGDEIGLQWDPYNFCLNFSVLKRSSVGVS